MPGIPVTDLGRMAQAAGIRVISFRHEQHAGYAASIAGFLTQKPGVCLTVSAPGFLNGLTALAHATTNCFPMILISAIGVVVTPVSILAITAIYALEVLVAFIQAYVFTILTCVYLKDALHPGH